jgi:hypothetical protein
MKRWLAALMLASAIAVAKNAHADAIEGPPDVCPPGSHGVASHDGSWCEASVCSSDADCAKQDQEATLWGGASTPVKTVCRSVAQCESEDTYKPRWSGGESKRRVVVGACNDPKCTAPAACVTAMRCVAPPKRCGCDAGSNDPLGLAIVALPAAIGLLGMLRARKRSR